VRNLIFLVVLSLALFQCKNNEQNSVPREAVDYVNPFIGTGGHGHTYPGASMPFGSVQLSPDSRLEGWDGCGGYHYTDSIVYGFSHTHLSGTGVSDYGDVLFMPTTGPVLWKNGYELGVDLGYASRFDHDKEQASAGYYTVDLLDYDVKVDLTVTQRAGFHKYTFPASNESNIILDLEHRDQLLDADIQILNDSTIQGKRLSKAWAVEQHIYFYAQFSKGFKASQLQQNKILVLDDSLRNTKAAFTFDTEAGETIMLKVGISAVSMEGARKNLEAEIDHWDFDKTKTEARQAWITALDKISVKGGTEEEKSIFYTALYHSLLNPNLFMDVDGKYRGTDLKIHQAEDYNNYTIFSLWDTYRGAHPLYTIIEQERTLDFIKTFLNQYKNGGQLPVWELAGNYTGCMIGYHSVSVIADAYAKGIRDFDAALALEAMKHSANQDHLGLDALKNVGYIPADHEPESVSKTLEYAYDDWCIAQMAKAIGEEEDYEHFQKRSQYYKNIFDPNEGFMRGKMYNMWFSPFDPAEVNFNYTEANCWQYSFCVQQDIPGMIELYGGAEAFEDKLDQLFETDMELTGRHQSDITGLIGQYAHGNEPSHHMAYLYNYIGKPWKTQERVREILNTMYHNQPDGLSGNEDCGQMSAWYVLSAMGFYAVTPGHPFYAIGTPIFEEVNIKLENGNLFTIKTKGLSEKNKYIQSAVLNGEPLNEAFLQHKDIVNGGALEISLGSKPNKNWGTGYSMDIQEPNSITTVPYFDAKSRTFTESLQVKIKSADPDSKIYFSLGDKPATSESSEYQGPITLKETATINAIAIKDGKASFPIKSEFFKIDGNRSIKLLTEYANQYAAGGENALIDYMKGSNSYRTGAWQGFQGEDLIAVVDLKDQRTSSNISIGFIQDVRSWIWFPKQVVFEISDDGENFKTVATLKHEFSDREEGSIIHRFQTPVSETFRYLKITAENYGPCPDWHLGAGGKSWLFADEIEID
jgi:predicted alpha-1,2-mannosidase